MGSKSKRRHAQKQYNRAQNKPVTPEVTEPVVDVNNTAPETLAAAPIMTAKEVRQMEKARQKEAKRQAKEQAKLNKDKDKTKNKDKKPFFLIRFFKWLGNVFAGIASELKKVHWPTFKQIAKATGIVLGIIIVFGILLLGIWTILGLLHYLLINGTLEGWSLV